MRSLSVADVSNALSGHLTGLGTVTDPAAGIFSGIGTDTRKDLRGQLFIALQGESFDAHDFLEKAIAAGASGLIVHRLSPSFKAPPGVWVFQVKDTLKALQALGQWNRRQMKARILGITGSNGKTTSKAFTAQLLGSRKKTHASVGSYNNHWGVPLTLLELQPEHEIGVVEMGMNHAGELTELVRIAEPDYVVCTTVGRAHVEHFGSVEKIAEAKEEIYLASKADCLRIFNLDNEWTRQMRVHTQALFPAGKTFAFSGADAKADVHLKIETLGVKDLVVTGHILGVAGRARVPVFGEQNLTNLMVAASFGATNGLSPKDVWEGLELCRTEWGRNQIVRLRSGAEMIFDGYNANPDSMKALMDNMKRVKVPGRKIGVFGQMRELGGASAELHEEIGRAVGGAGFDKVYFVGSDLPAFEKGLRSESQVPLVGGIDFQEDMASDLGHGLKPGDLVVVKASRGTKLERFVPACEPLDFGEKQG